MAKCEQIDPGVETQPRFESGDRCEVHEHVVATATSEAHVVGHEDVIDPRLDDRVELGSLLGDRELEEGPGRADADSQR